MHPDATEDGRDSWSVRVVLRLFSNRSKLTILTLYAVASVFGAVLAERAVLPSGFGPWYPPAGLAFAVLVIYGWRVAPLVFLVRLAGIGVTFPSVFSEELPWVLLRAFAIVGIYTAGGELLRRARIQHAELHDLGWFVAIGIFVTPLSSAIATGLIAIAHGATTGTGFSLMREFWIGDAVSIAAVVPPILIGRHLLSKGRFDDVGGTHSGRFAAMSQAIALFLTPVLALAVQRDNIGFLLIAAILPSVWVANARDPLSATLGVLLLNTVIAFSASVLLGPSVALVELQAVMLSASLSAFYVIALTRSHNRRLQSIVQNERKAAEEERLRSLGLTAGGVAHDLRNFLGVISGYAQLLRQDSLPLETRRECAENIENATSSAAKIATRLLTFAKNRPTEKEVVGTHEFLTAMIPLLNGLQTRNIHVRTDVSAESAHINIDTAELESVIVNLVLNAVQASPDGADVMVSSNVVTLTEYQTEQRDLRPGRWFVLRVEDHGRGIPTDVLPHVFEPFFTTKSRTEGTGLGLSNVRTVTEDAGGFAELKSVEGTGTIVEVYLPTIDDYPSLIATRAGKPVSTSFELR